ncbi:MAG: EpsG family protein [Opitutae bacterium]|nr:EpsG family protein [Opitutae bacterium]
MNFNEGQTNPAPEEMQTPEELPFDPNYDFHSEQNFVATTHKWPAPHLIFALCFALVMAILAFRFEPSPGMDLARYYATIESGNLSQYSVDAYGDAAYADIVVAEVMSFLVRHNISSHFLGAICGFIHFFLLAKIASLWSGKVTASNSIYPLFIVLFLSGFLLGFTGVRQSLANQCFILGVIYWDFGDKKRAAIFSILSPLIHFSLIPIVCLFWVANLSSKKLAYAISGALCVAGLLFYQIVNVIQAIFSRIGGIFSAISSKIDSYIFNAAAGEGFIGVVKAAWTGDERYIDSCYWAGSRWWVAQSFWIVGCTALLIVFKQREIKLSFLKDSCTKFLFMLFGYCVFTFQAPAIPLRSFGLIKTLGILAIFPLAFRYRKPFAVLVIAVLLAFGLLANFSGKEILQLLRGGRL